MTQLLELLNTFGYWLTSRLWQMSIELFILAVVVYAVIHLLRIKSPAIRHLFWCLVLIKPVATFLLASPLSLYSFLPQRSVQADMPAQSTPVIEEVTVDMVDAEPLAEERSVEKNVPPIDVPAVTADLSTPPEIVSLSAWQTINRYGIVAVIWSLVSAVFLLRLFLGFAYVTFLRQTAELQRTGPLADAVVEALRALNTRRRVHVAVSAVAHGPVLAGVIRPVILLPKSLVEELSPAQLEFIITHELAHVRRWDNLSLLLQRFAEMFLFFHPVVWFCGWTMRREAEAACDSAVLAAYEKSAEYADSLTRVAEMRFGFTRRLLVNTFAAAESNLATRIKRILGGETIRMTVRLTMASVVALAALGFLGLPGASTEEKKPKLAQVPEPRPFAVEGVVTDGEGHPMPGAEISVMGGWGTLRGVGRATTGSDGRFLVRFGPRTGTFSDKTWPKNIPIQAATIRARKKGFYEKDLCRAGGLGMAGERPVKAASGFSPDQVLIPGETHRLDFVMLPAANIVGQLLDKKRNPMKERRFHVVGEVGPSGSALCNVTTDDEGRFTIGEVPLKPYAFRTRTGVAFNEVGTRPFNFAVPGQYEIKLVYDDSNDVKPSFRSELISHPSGVSRKEVLNPPPAETVVAAIDGKSTMGLQEMIDAAEPNGVVVVPEGTYTEPITINKPITLKGADAEESVLDITSDKPCITITSDKLVTIDSLTIKWQRKTSGQSTSRLCALFVLDGNASVKNCRFIAPANPKRCPAAVIAMGFSDLALAKCRFEGFEFTVAFWGGAKGSVKDCVVMNPGHCGITVGGDCTVDIFRNIVTGSRYHGIRCTGGTLRVKDNLIVANKNRGIYLGNKSAHGEIVNNVIMGNATGISGFSRTDVKIENNLILNSGYAGLDFRYSCGLLVRNNIFMENTKGIVLHKEIGRNKSTVGKNTFWKNGQDTEYIEKSASSLSVDPRFMDPENGNFSSTVNQMTLEKQGLLDPSPFIRLWAASESDAALRFKFTKQKKPRLTRNELSEIKLANMWGTNRPPEWTSSAILAMSMDKDTIVTKGAQVYMADLSGVGNHAQVFGAGPANGKIGQAMLFKKEYAPAKPVFGANHLFVWPDPSLNLTTNITIAVWISKAPVVDPYARIVDKGWSSAYVLGLFGGRSPGKRPGLQLKFNMCFAKTNLEPDRWYHVVSTFDGKEMRIYVDGKKEVAKKWAGQMVKNDYPLCIGLNHSTKPGGEAFTGLIDELAIWGKALSEDEILSLYKYSLNGKSYCKAIGYATGKFKKKKLENASPQASSKDKAVDSNASLPESGPALELSHVDDVSDGPPRIVSTVPMKGANDVDPDLSEITVTFDRDMAGGFSWTGGGEVYPEVTGRPHWLDKRTCVLPVNLKEGHFYRVGINSKSHRNFKSAGKTGTPVLPTAIYFCTRGASEEERRKVRIPKITHMVPRNGAKDVDPNLKELKVTFDIPMGGGFSWTGGGEEYPEGTGRPRWSKDRLTCTRPVTLAPGRKYRLGLNSPSHNNFQSRWGVPLPPVRWTFVTSGKRQLGEPNKKEMHPTN